MIAKASPAYQALTEQMERAILLAVSKVQDHTVARMITEQIEAGDVQGALDAIRMDLAASELNALIPVVLRQAYEQAALSEENTLRSASMNIRFDVVSQAALDYVKEHSAQLIEEFGTSSLEAIRTLIERAMTGQFTPAQLAKEIINSGIGLTERQAVALDNLRTAMEQKGYTSAQIEKNLAQAYDRALKFRAKLIAKHEIGMATRNGRRATWRQAADKGLISQNQKRRWDTTESERVCPECEALDGVTTGLNEEYPNGGGDGPLLHIGCECVENLVIE